MIEKPDVNLEDEILPKGESENKFAVAPLSVTMSVMTTLGFLKKLFGGGKSTPIEKKERKGALYLKKGFVLMVRGGGTVYLVDDINWDENKIYLLKCFPRYRDVPTTSPQWSKACITLDLTSITSDFYRVVSEIPDITWKALEKYRDKITDGKPW